MPVYLDNNSTTALDNRVLEKMVPWMTDIPGNASSLHRFGRLQSDALNDARSQVAALVGARPEQVIFTSGGTESNNLVLQGVFAATGKRCIVIGRTEHPSVLEPAHALEHSGAEVIELPVNPDGSIKLDYAERIMASRRDDIALLSVMLANNETGVLQDVAKLAIMARENGIWIHTDATQAAGKVPVDMASLDVHSMTLSAHKIYGPKGAGALVVDNRLPVTPMLTGGSQERGLRAGTENVAAIVGFGAAAELALAEMPQRELHALSLRDHLQHKLESMPGIVVFAGTAERLPNTLQFGVTGFDGETLLMQLDRKGYAVSSGSACNSGKDVPSHVLSAMGVNHQLALTAIRVSTGKDNTKQDVEGFVAAISEITRIKQEDVMLAATV